jgi:GNAT superfamily N-acetyltransferase
MPSRTFPGVGPDPRLDPRFMLFRLTGWTGMPALEQYKTEYPGIYADWEISARHVVGTFDEWTDSPPIGKVKMRTVNLTETGWDRHALLHVADEEGGDIFDLFERDWMDAVEDEPYRLVFVESVRLEPELRGYGLGPLLMGTALHMLPDPELYAVCNPAPFRDEPVPGKTEEQAVEALGRTWAKLGFEHLGDNIWGVDLRLAAPEKRFAEVQAEVLDRLQPLFPDD